MMRAIMRRDDVSKLLLRFTVASMMLLHGLAKLRHGIAGIVSAVVAHGLPSFVAYGVYVGEVLAPCAILLGLFTRYAAAILAFNMAVAVWLAHPGDLFHLGKGGGYALELQLFYFVGALAIALVGPGPYALRDQP
jgi:putative oxidoreductase